MKRKGISLIVLIITMVVIIILGTAIVVNLAKTSIINNAKEATVKQDFKTLQDELSLHIANEYVNTKGEFKAETFTVVDKDEIAEILPTIKNTKYSDYVIIENGKIAIVDTMPEPDKTWAMESLGVITTTNNTPTEDTQAPTTPINLEVTVTENNITAVASGSTDNKEVSYQYSIELKESTEQGKLKDIELVARQNNIVMVSKNTQKVFNYAFDIETAKWQGSGEFKDLESAKDYVVYARAVDKAGNVSGVIEKNTKTKYNIVKGNNINDLVVGGNALKVDTKPAYNNPIIPVGFKAVETSKASWTVSNGVVSGWNNGLVIKDSSDNEYVWIPVDGTNVQYAKWNGSKNTDYTVTKEQTEEDTLPNGIISQEEQITKYGGFYVARYEASLPDDQTTATLMATKIFDDSDNNRTDIGKPQSKPNKIVWNKVSYVNAKILADNVISTKYVQSGLITGTQWDTMLDFLSQTVNVDTNCLSWGNYYDKYGYTINGYYRPKHDIVAYSNGQYTKSANGDLLLPTGKFGSVITAGSPKNLYDVAGNVWEWTAETVIKKGGTNTAVGNPVRRGGSYHDYSNSSVASYRHAYSPTNVAYVGIGFRFVLYVK